MRKATDPFQALSWRPLERLASVLRKQGVARIAVLLPAALLWTACWAPTIWGQGIHPRPRVSARIDNGRRALLSGQRPVALRNAVDLGRVPGNTAMDHMVMVLQPAPEQEQALQTLLDQQLDKNHANYHRWLTPDEFGAQFGVDDADLAQVESWLAGQGLRVEGAGRGKRFVQFSGNVSQVESAFGTEMHRFRVNGQMHTANASDISVPEALRPVINSVPTLHDFFKKPNMQDAGTVTADEVPAEASGRTYYAAHPVGIAPNFTNGGSHYVGAADFATIYNTRPLLNAGFDGTGVSIAILGRTDIHLSDVQVYRTFFGLKSNDPVSIVAGTDPGVVGGDDGESYLDVEISGGVAPGATVKFVTAATTLTSDGVDLAALYAVENNIADIISFSYGQCEATVGTSLSALYNTLWQQAAAQGQSVFVSTGDSGPATCDSSGSTFSSFGYAVNVLASTPYNVAVGGTMFADTAANWSSANNTAIPFSSALGYIPETPWNESRGSGAVGATGLWSGGGGISAYYKTPAWQRGFGVPASDPGYPNNVKSDPSTPYVTGPHRYLPDVAVAAAASHDGTVYCAEGNCQLTSSGSLASWGVVGGTSVAAPSMAGLQALVNQVNGGRQGLPNYVYYGLANAQHTAGLSCASNSVSLDPSCAFHDVTSGNALVCGDSSCTTAKKLGWTTTAGYDLATGLGSPNAYQLATLWNTVTFTGSTTTLNVSPKTGIIHGHSVTLSGAVTHGSGTGTPTGQVAFLVDSGAITDATNSSGNFVSQAAVATLNGSGIYSVDLTTLPAGTYNVTARYGGDSTFGSSTSAPVQVTVTPEASGVIIQTSRPNGSCSEVQATSFTYGAFLWTDVIVSGGSGKGVPTGTVAITDNSSPLLTAALNSEGVGTFLSGAIRPGDCGDGYLFQNAVPPVGGVHVLGATYSGDGSFNSMTATPLTLTITKATVTGTLATASSNVSSGGTAQLSFTLTGLSGAGPGTLSPGGTVTFTDNTTSTVLGTATLTGNSSFGAVAVLSTTAIVASGAHSIVASWPGDNNYNAVNSTAVSVTVQSGTPTSVAVTSNANPTTVGGRPRWTATMTPTTVTSGTVNFFDNGVLLGSGTVGGTHTATFQPGAAVNLPAGVHTITAIYAGTATYNSSTSDPFQQTFNKASTTIQLTAKSSGTLGEAFSLSAVLGLSETAVPPISGSVQFFDGTALLGSAPFTIVSEAAGGSGAYQGQMAVPDFTGGPHTITAVLNDTNYTAPTSNAQTITVVVPKTAQSITFLSPGNKTYGDADFGLSATASSSLAVSFRATGDCTVSGTTVHLTGAGSCIVTASQAGDSTYDAAPGVPRIFAIAKGSQTISFAALDGKNYGDADFGVSAAASSGLAVTFAAAGNCTLSGTTVHLTGPGSCTVTASQAGNGNYNAATDVAQGFAIGKGSQTISFAALSGKVFGNPDFTVAATSTSGLTVTFSAAGDCTVTGTTVHLTGAGSCTLTALQPGNSNFAAAADVPRGFTIAKASQTITFAALGDKTYGDADFSVGATASSSLTVSFAAAGNCTVAGTTVHLTGGGSCTITASQAGNTNYSAASDIPRSFNVGKTVQTITFATLGGKTYGDADFLVDATASSGLAVTFAASGNCTLSGTTVHLTGGGACTVTASQPGNANYSAAVDVPRSFNIAKAAQTITFAVLGGKVYGDADFPVGATASSSLAVTFAATGTCAVTGTTVHITGGGSCTLTASQAGDANYSGAADVPRSFSIAKAAQTITFAPLTSKVFGDADLLVGATASSSLAVNFTAAGHCTVTGATVHLTGSGSCTLTASQAGNANYSVATDVPQSFSIAKAAQTITFATLSSKNYGDADFSISATASSTLAVGFAAAGNCTVTGTTVHLTGSGSCTITASQAGNADYSSAADVPRSFTIAKAAQTITFAALGDKSFGDADFSVSATASSSLAVSFAATGNCTVTGTTVHLTGAGSCTITASQTGNVDYSAAADLSRSFTIAKAAQTITFAALGDKSYGDADFSVSATASSSLTVSFAATGNCMVTGTTVHLTGAGSCTVTASQAGNGNYSAAIDLPRSFTIAKLAQSIAFAALADKTFGDADFSVSATATSSAAVSFAGTGNCTVTGSTVHLTGGGSCTVTASQAGNANYHAAIDAPRSFAIARLAQTITFAALDDKSFGDADFGVSATSTSGLSVSFAATGNCTVSGTAVHLTGGGTCTVTASQAGSSDYNAATNVPQSFSIAKAVQTITFAPLTGKTFGDADFSVSATASSSLAVSFVASGSCTVTGTSVHLTGGGNCTITASQSGNGSYQAAADVPRSFAVARAAQAISFGALAGKTFGDADFSVSATANSSLSVSFTANGNCTVTGTSVHLTGAGSCTLTAAQPGDGSYNAAASVPQGFAIAKAGQTITFAALGNKTFGDADFNIAATASSSLAVTFAAGGNCTLTGTTVHLTGAGSCTVTASQSGSVNYNAAVDVPRMFSVAKSGQTITFPALPGKTIGDPDFTVSAVASSGLTVSFAAAGSCTVSGATVHLTASGSCTITASQFGDATYNVAVNVPQTFTVGGSGQTIAFGALAGRTFGDPDFNVSATASSGLPVSFAASGSCTVIGALVHLTGGGSCTITASQAGNGSYGPAANVPQTFTIARTAQTITFAALNSKTFGDADFSVSAASSSSLAVTLTAAGNCTITAGTVHLTAGGACTITAAQAGNANYSAAADVPRSFTIARAAQTITFAALGGKTFGDADFTVGAASTSGLAVSFAASGNCTVAGAAVHLTGAGSCTLTASQSGDSSYAAAAGVPQSFPIAKAAQTITFAPLGARSYGDAEFNVSATSSSALAVSFAAFGNCSVTGAIVHLTGVGSCTVTASQTGDGNYLAAAGVPQSFPIAKAAQTITFAPLGDKSYGDADFSVSATSSSSLAVSFSATGSCTIAGTTVHLTGVGSCTVTASQAGDSNYSAAASVPQSFPIAKAAQTITFAPLGDKSYGDADFSVSASATSGLAVNFTAAGVCSVTSTTVHIAGAGACTITASQAGDSSYSAAAGVPQSFTVARAVQTITFAALGDKSYGDADFNVSATSSSSLAVSFTAAGSCTVTGTTVHLTGGGSCTITAAQAGDANYSSAANVQRTFTVAGMPQTITFAALGSKIFGDADFNVSASASSSLAVSFTAAGNCTVTGATVHLTGSGSCIITALQPGDASYRAAADVPRSFIIAKAAQAITLTQPATPIVYGSTTTMALNASGGSSGNAVTFNVSSGPAAVNGSTLTVTGAGSIVITASQVGNANYAAATPVSRTVVVLPASSALSVPGGVQSIAAGSGGDIVATVTGQFTGAGIAAPAGHVTFSVGEGINTSANVNIVHGTATWAFPVASAVAGHVYTVTIGYAGDGNYSAAVATSAQVQTGQIQPVISWAQPSALVYGATLANVLHASALNGGSPVTGAYSYTASPAGGSAAAVTQASILGAGNYTLAVAFTPTNTAAYASATGSVTLLVNKAAPGVTLTSSLNPVLLQNATTLTATLSSSAPTGTVTFFDGTTSLGAATVNASGVAALAISTLSMGTHTLSAVYSGDANFDPVSSAPLTQSVLDFNLGATSGQTTDISVVPGGTVSYHLTFSPVGSSTFLDPITFAVTGLPAGATYTLTPASIAAGSGPVNMTMAITVPNQSAALQHRLPGGGAAAVALGLLLLPFSRRTRRSALKSMRLMALLLVFAGMAAGLIGCGAGRTEAQLAHIYPVTLTARSGVLSHTTNFTLTVQAP